jgi:hypothetical protein
MHSKWRWLAPDLPFLTFPVLSKHGVNVLKGSIYLFPHLGSSENDLARDKNEEHNLGVFHTVNQPREELRLILPTSRN